MTASSASEVEKSNDLFAVDIALATKLHLEYLIVHLVRDFYSNHTFKDDRIRPILDLILQVVAVKMLMKES